MGNVGNSILGPTIRQWPGGNMFIQLKSFGVTAGQMIEGVVNIDLKQPYPALELVISLRGFEYVEFRKQHSR